MEMNRRLVLVPSDEGADGNLYFLSAEGAMPDSVRDHVAAAVSQSSDENGDRSGEVINYLERQGYIFMGNPDTENVIVTQPWVVQDQDLPAFDVSLRAVIYAEDVREAGEIAKEKVASVLGREVSILDVCEAEDSGALTYRPASSSLGMSSPSDFAKEVSQRFDARLGMVQGAYTSVWDGGVEVTTDCRINLKTGEVNADPAEEILADNLNSLDDQYVTIKGRDFKVHSAEFDTEVIDLIELRNHIEGTAGPRHAQRNLSL